MSRAMEVVTAIALVALMSMLVRPGSKGPALVSAIGSAFVNAAVAAIGTDTPHTTTGKAVLV